MDLHELESNLSPAARRRLATRLAARVGERRLAGRLLPLEVAKARARRRIAAALLAGELTKARARAAEPAEPELVPATRGMSAARRSRVLAAVRAYAAKHGRRAEIPS